MQHIGSCFFQISDFVAQAAVISAHHGRTQQFLHYDPGPFYTKTLIKRLLNYCVTTPFCQVHCITEAKGNNSRKIKRRIFPLPVCSFKTWSLSQDITMNICYCANYCLNRFNDDWRVSRFQAEFGHALGLPACRL